MRKFSIISPHLVILEARLIIGGWINLCNLNFTVEKEIDLGEKTKTVGLVETLISFARFDFL